MRFRRLFLLCLLSLTVSTQTVFAQDAPAKRAITEKDIFAFTWIGDAQVSPDGSQVAYVQVTVNAKQDGYDTAIYLVPTSGTSSPRRLTSGPSDSSPRWSPDGKTLCFTRTPIAAAPPAAGAPPPSPQLWLLSFSGGDPWPITSQPRGASAPVWSPDGKRIVFSSSANPDDLAKAKAKPGERSTEHESDVRVVTRAQYRNNGGGFADPKHPGHLWVIDVSSGPEQTNKPLQLTSGPYSEGSPIWSPDNAKIYFTSVRVPEPYYEILPTDIYSVPASGGEMTKLLTADASAGGFSLSADGNKFAFRGSLNKPVLSYRQSDLWTVDAAPNAASKNLTLSMDFDIGSGVGGDQRAPRGAAGSRPLWSKDGASIIELVGKQGRANLERFDAVTGKATPVTSGDQDVQDWSASRDGSKLVVLISTSTNIGDLYLVDPFNSTTAPKRLTDVNGKLFSQLNITAPEEFWYTSFDGKKIQTWVQKPPDFDPKKKYPLILNIHGGPHAAYGFTFDHEFQWMAAKGYIVLYPNPRGSTTYGQDFGNIIQYHYPGDDYKDLMAGVDEMIKRGSVDPKRLGVTGGSGGGILTNWIVTRTDRFAAAVAQRSIADWYGFWFTTDFTLFQPSWFKGAPWQDPVDFAARSPITNVDRVKTPLMLIEGDADLRTPPADGGEMMFRALKFMKKPTVMVRFPGESHELSRSGNPWHRVERLQHIVNWFDIYLMGKKIPGYEALPTDAAASTASLDDN